MGLFKRISDIISANLNEMVDGMEDPELVLKQAIQEMEVSIRQATEETAKTLANEKRVAKELSRHQSQCELWSSRAAQAVDAGDDELTRRALTRQREHQSLVVALQQQLESSQGATKTLRTQLEAMQAKLAEAKRNLATLSARQKAAQVRKDMLTRSSVDSDLAVDDSAFEKFERMRRRVEQTEAEAEALAELQGLAREQDDAWSRDPRVDEDAEIEARLAELKRQRQQGKKETPEEDAGG